MIPWDSRIKVRIELGRALLETTAQSVHASHRSLQGSTSGKLSDGMNSPRRKASSRDLSHSAVLTDTWVAPFLLEHSISG